MTLVQLLRWHRAPSVRVRRVALPPLTLRGPLLILVRTVWIVMAASALLVWVLEAPFYYHAALQLRNTSGMVNLPRSEWVVGLHGLGLTSSAYALQSIVSLALMAGCMYVAGLLIFVRRSNEWIALLVSYSFVSLGAGIMSAYGGLDVTNTYPVLNQPLNAYLLLASFAYYALFLIPLVFPDGRFVPRWTLWLIGLLALKVLGQSVGAGSVLDSHTWPVWLGHAESALVAIAVLAAPVYRYRRVSDSTQRQQTKWVMLGLIVALGVFFAVGLLDTVVPWFTSTPERAVLFGLVAPTLADLAMGFLPITFAIAILRYRLWDIDLILNRTLVYACLTGSVIGLYVLVVVGLGALFQAQGSLGLSLLATALVAILFHPLHLRLQRGVNRMLYGQRDEPYTVLSRLGQQLEGALAPEAVLPAIVETVTAALKLPYAAINLKQQDELVEAAAVGTQSGEPLRLPLLYQGETVGELILGTRPGEEGFSQADQRLLNDLARQAGVATYAVRLTTDLQRSRVRLVTAREEERRRLRRDLHDGLGPALASVTLMADAARNLLADNPHAADALLLNLKGEAQVATAEIRRVVYQLRPPALDELGLVPALEEQVAQFAQSGLHVAVDAPQTLPPLSAAVEVAAYRIVQEAMTNVVRHAHARTCLVRLWVDEGLHLEVADDGRGVNGARHGVGLTSMRERAEELGGKCAVEPRPGGGTRVRASLPLPGNE